MRFLFKAFLIVFLSAFIGLGGYELRSRYQDHGLVLEEPLTNRAVALRDSGQLAEARMLAGFVLEHPLSGDVQLAGQLSSEIEESLASTASKLKRFGKGAVSGEVTDMASLLGSLSLDLFVIGDIRDLAVQGWKQVQYDNGDELIMILSGIGLATTLAPQIDWAPALMKSFKRTGSLTKPFIRSLKTTGRQAIKTGEYGKLKGVVTGFGNAARHIGPGPLRGVMKNVDKAGDLRKVGKAAKRDPKATYVLTTIFGKNGVKKISHNGGNIRKLAGTVKVASRLAKISKKSIGIVPTMWLLMAIGLASTLLAGTMLLPKKKKRLLWA